ncbi:MAG TPA: hypothetical protein VF747_04380 [Blastocatellia bacterium]
MSGAFICRYLKIAAGLALLIAGVAGLVLPIIPGLPLLVAGAAILGPRHPVIRPFSRRWRWWRKRRKIKQVTI